MDSKLKLQEGTIAFYMDESEHWHQVAKVRAKKYELSQRWSWVPWGLVVVQSLAVGVIGVKAMATN